MLMDIREKIRGWLAYVIVGLISIPFALWGVGEYLGGGKETVVAEVQGHKITARELDQAFSERRQQLIAQSDRQITAEMIEQMGLKRQVLDQMINEQLLIGFIQQQGYAVPDELVAATIRNIGAFQVDGQFDREAYQRRLAQLGLSVEQFEDDVRRDLLFSTLDNALVGSAFVTAPEVEQLVALRDQSRRIGLMRIDRDAIAAGMDPADEATLRAYYEEHQAAFQRPEQLRLSYVEITPDVLADAQEIDETALQSAYEDYRNRQSEQTVRKARHILIQVPSDADATAVEAARERLEKARQAIIDGEVTFEEKARELSDDVSSRDAGGDLGRVGGGEIAKSFDEAVATLAEGEVSETIRTRFGWHLIQVYDLSEAEIEPFDQMREELLAQLRRDQAESAYYDASETLASISYEQPDSLIPAAEALGLSVQTSDWISREAGEGIGRYPAVREAAFDKGVLDERFNSQLIELGNSHAVVVRVEDHREAEARSFEAVRGQVAEQWRMEALETAVAERAAALSEALAKGADPAELADETEAATWIEAAWVQREDVDQTIPAAALAAGFGLTPPSMGEVATAIATLDGGDKAVVALYEVRPGQPADLDAEARLNLASQLESNQANRLIDAFMRSLRAQADVEIRERAFD